MKVRSYLLIIAVALIAGAPCFSAPIQFEVEKSNPQFPDYPIPDEERSSKFVSTVDLRRVTLEGEISDPPVIVSPATEKSLSEVYKPLAAYLALSKKKDISLVLPLYDEDGKKFILSLPKEQQDKALEITAATEFYEMHLLVERENVVFLYGYVISKGSKSFIRFRLIKSSGAYKIGAGAPSISMKYDTLISLLVAQKGFSPFKKVAPAK